MSCGSDHGSEGDGAGSPSLTRRATLQAGVAAAGLPLSGNASASERVAPSLSLAAVGETLPLQFTANGRAVTLKIDPRTSLLDLLRERLELTGAKKGCDHGQCGACTVHVDDRRVASCLTLAAKVEGRRVTTIEGLSDGEQLHPMQQAFIDHDALQCGYCTPGQIMAAVACVHEGHASDRADIREYMSGNICRCGAYVGIVAAIEDAAGKMERKA